MIICQCFMWMESRKISTGVACNKMEIRSQPHDMFAAHLLHNTSISLFQDKNSTVVINVMWVHPWVQRAYHHSVIISMVVMEMMITVVFMMMMVMLSS